jgi:hypothetical protein
LDDEVGPRRNRLGHGAAHLLLLRPVLATGHLGRDLVQPGHAIVSGLERISLGATRRTEDIEVVESVGLGEGVEVLVRHRR